MGMAVCMHGTGIAGLDMGAASIKLNDDGSFNLLVGATDLGTGSDTVLAQIAAETLGVPLEHVIIYSSRHRLHPLRHRRLRQQHHLHQRRRGAQGRRAGRASRSAACRRHCSRRDPAGSGWKAARSRIRMGAVSLERSRCTAPTRPTSTRSWRRPAT
jgi:hypothetical protein